MVGECFHFISKIIHFASWEEIDNGTLKNDEKLFELDSDLKLNGNHVGKVFARLKVKFTFYMEQKLAGVLTEDGIKNSDPLIIQIKSK